jgi:ribonuclease-3
MSEEETKINNNSSDNEELGDNEESEIVIVNPYNFNNKLLKKNDVQSLLSKYDINLEINDLSLYQRAFIHKSYCKKNPEDIGENVEIAEKPEGALELMDEQNERLEFLGDTILSSVVGKYLFQRYPTEDEGFMTRMRTKLVNGETLSKFAKELNFGTFIMISRHVEDKCNGRESVKILEDCFEAFIGALFLDFDETECESGELKLDFYSGLGFQICDNFIINLLESTIDFSELIMNDYNYKDQLLRYFQQAYHQTPKYKELLVEGPPNDRQFTMCVLDIEGEILTEGTGKSKKKAEQMASKNALIKFGVISEDNVLPDMVELVSNKEDNETEN